MSRKLRVTQEDSVKYIESFLKLLQSIKPTSDKFSFSGVMESDDRRAKLIFTPLAWEKMNLLIHEFDKEIAWHGACERASDETKDEYIVSDIVVYPQSTNGTYVDMDEDGYSAWITQNIDAPWQGKLRMQGHSHVGMPTEPSGTDMQHQEEVLATCRKEDFKIFVIWNKKGSHNIYIYDKKKNLTFGPKEVDVEIQGTGYDPAAFLKEAHAMVKSYVYTVKTTTAGKHPMYDADADDEMGVYNGGGYGYGSGYGYGNAYRYGAYGYGATQPASKSSPGKTAPAKTEIAPAKATKTDTAKPDVISLAARQKVTI